MFRASGKVGLKGQDDLGSRSAGLGRVQCSQPTPFAP